MGVAPQCHFGESRVPTLGLAHPAYPKDRAAARSGAVRYDCGFCVYANPDHFCGNRTDTVSARRITHGGCPGSIHRVGGRRDGSTFEGRAVA